MDPFPLPPRDVHPGIEDPPPGIEELAELHTRLVDTVAGFDKMIEKATPELAPIARDFHALHAAHARAVAGMLGRDGHDPAQDGSIFGAVNRGLVTARAWFDDVGLNLMEPLIQGEKHVLDAYDDAIARAADAGRRGALEAMRARQVELMDRHLHI